MNRENQSTRKKKPLLKEIEDVISIGALLRPSIVKAVAALKPSEIDTVRNAVIEAEKHLANSRLPFRDRFAMAQESLVKTYAIAPIWRFIAGRIEYAWRDAHDLTVRELSLVSLLFGIVLEETQAHAERLGVGTGRRSA